MPTTAELRTKLITKLKELFQLDQPELDFGFYRIMHAKAEQVQRFLEKDLLQQVEEAFADHDQARVAQLKQAYEESLANARNYGAPDPEQVPAVQEAMAAWKLAKESNGAEADVYDHLYRFFERYYEDGDFVSRRYLTRETDGKAAPYAVPYNGQEVMLHWANRDQYYIKTSERFDNYTFDAREAARKLREGARADKAQAALDLDEGLLKGDALRVHFRLVQAAEGEHNNVKEGDGQKRQFFPHQERPVEMDSNGELLLNFEYRPLPGGYDFNEKEIKEAYGIANKGDLPANWMAHVFLQAVGALKGERAKQYGQLLATAAPTAKQTKRTLLAKYVQKYTASNTMDYFIHKDLGGFLRRELDFYLKNEVMHLDDITGAEAPQVESYLAKLKVIRSIAQKLIDFLAQLENFQKKLWLKKKFVVETNWCITLDRVPEDLYLAIAANEAQKAEWERLFHIQELEGYEAECHLSVDFLKANPYLVLDTAFLSEEDKAVLLSNIDDLERQTNGLLVHSENFQALRFLETRYREQVKCIYIDPPYNTTNNDFMYKDSFKRSSWSSMIMNRIEHSMLLMPITGVMFSSIGEEELDAFTFVAGEVYGRTNVLERTARVQKKGSDKGSFYNPTLDYVITTVVDKTQLDGFTVSIFDESKFKKIETSGARMGERYEDSKSLYQSSLDARPNQRYWIECPDGSFVIPPGETYPDEVRDGAHVLPRAGEGCWRWSWDNYLSRKDLIVIRKSKQSPLLNEKRQPAEWNVYTKRYLKDAMEKGNTPVNLISNYPNAQGTDELSALGLPFSYPKPTGLIKHLVQIASKQNDITVLDFFAGSGTTAQAVIDINRSEKSQGLGEGQRVYLLVEMSEYFDTLILPRLKKVVYSRSWKAGIPGKREGISHCFKYIRLESYEDTLNALELRTDATRERLLQDNTDLREDYTLRYLLDVETQGSASLLNIEAFRDPRNYTLEVKRPGSEERITKTVDLIETFNYLLGLRVERVGAPQTFSATFERDKDKDLPEEQNGRLRVKNRDNDPQGPYWFRTVQGWMPRDRSKPDGERDKVMVIWRNLTDNREKDNAMLDHWFQKSRLNPRESEYDVIYVNGSNNLSNLLQEGERWKVRLIEEDFHRLMWEGTE